MHDSGGDHLPADLTWREIGVLAPLAVLCVYIGLQPKPLTDAMQGSVDDLLAAYPAAVQQYLAETAGAEPADLTLVADPRPGKGDADG